VDLPNTLVGLLIHLLFRYLMTDSKSRKVIIVENTYLPSYVKEHISQTLFDNLKASRIGNSRVGLS
jgi:actin-related protein 10